MDPLARKTTCRILELMDEGVFSAKFIAEAALSFMSEDTVREFAHAHELFLFVSEDAEEEAEDDDYDPLDDYNYVGSRHHY